MDSLAPSARSCSSVCRLGCGLHNGSRPVTPVHKKTHRSESGNYRLSRSSQSSAKYLIGSSGSSWQLSLRTTCRHQGSLALGRASLPPISFSSSQSLACQSLALSARHLSLVTALNTTRAFHCVGHHGLMVELQQLGITRDLLHLILPVG